MLNKIWQNIETSIFSMTHQNFPRQMRYLQESGK